MVYEVGSTEYTIQFIFDETEKDISFIIFQEETHSLAYHQIKDKQIYIKHS